MGAAPANDDTNAKDRVFVEQYDYSCYHRNEVKNRNRSESSSEEDQSKIHDVDADTKRGPTFEVQARDDLKIQPQPPQGPNINWERFLPAKSVKVLLVESDDSTRHVVSALLRNCSYEVTAVAHGLQAWTTLQDMSSHIDLVLTEVVMPFLSGFELLCRIMGHKNLKNIPVIMMSSHDSMGIVFKCLSKGAVDFLVKPIRKNELKNLWQHVWRRCHYSSGGSGSESGTQAKQSGKFRVSDDSESNTSSTNEHENGSNGLSIQSGSDDGSGAQTSWTKTAAEVNSIRPISPWNQGAEAPDSICAQVVYIRPEKLGTMDEDPGTVAMIKDVGIGISERQSTCKGMRMQDATPEIDHKPHEKGSQDQNLGNCGKFNEGLNDVSGTASSIPQPQSRDYEAVTGISTASNIRSKAKSDQREVPYLELTLKRLQGVVDAGTAAKDDHSILRHSDLSAFSKYNTVSSVNQGPSGNTGNSPIDNGSVAIKSERTFNFLSCSSGVQHTQQSSGSMNENELWLHRKFDAPDKVESPAAIKSSESSAFQPVQNGYVCSPRKELSGKADGSVSNKTQAPTQGSNQRIHIQHHHHHHHHHHYHHHVHNSKEAQQNPDLNELSLDNLSSAPPASGSPNLLDGHTEENGGDLSGGGSASGSNHGSNGNNGMNDIPSQGMANGDSENGTAKHCGITGKTNVSVVDEDRHAQREAALTKFRLKRKERCFEKRVRYQSRKKLAEQRPRIRGQFVRQTMSDAKVGNESQSSGTKG